MVRGEKADGVRGKKKMIYTCSICGYTFQGTGETGCCPGCRKEFIRKATAAEVREYISFQEKHPPGEIETKTAV